VEPVQLRAHRRVALGPGQREPGEEGGLPHEILPLSAVGVALVDFLLQSVV
jgi:hypothetical protein